MSEEQRRQLQQQLWNIANTLRGKMGADEFRDYILGFIFYKYLSEKIQRFADGELAQENLKFAEINESTAKGKEYIEALEDAALDELGYFLKPSEMFHAIAMKGSNQLDANRVGDSHNFILGDLTKILKNIEQSTQGTDSADDFVNLFEDLDLTSSKLGKTEKEKNDLVAKVLVHLDKIDFNLSDATADVLGDAYEYLIGEFASGAGKKAGEFYTPQPVSTLLAKLVTANNKNLKSVYDPTCGSGSLLLRVKREATNVDKIYGQELNRTTYNLARMNMILHDVHYADFDIRQEDTLERPQHRELRFDAIVANPPFSAQWSASQLHMNDDRFSVYGKLAPSSKADMAFVQHMVYQLAEEGTMAVVLPHGVLYRGGAEGHIRQYLIEQLNCLDAVIGLPANMFHGTVSIPVVVLVFKKCRKNPDNILFIDASQHFDKIKTKNVIRSEHIQMIVDAYKSWINEDKYSHAASIESIKSNNYNLNIPRYVDTFEVDDIVDLKVIAEYLKQLDEKSQEADKTIFVFCNELNIPAPKGNNVFWLTQYKKGVMQQIFSQELRFKDDAGQDFPEWRDSTLGDLTNFKNGKGHESIISDQGNFIVVNSKFIASDGLVFKKSSQALTPIEKDSIVMVMSDVPNGKALAKCFYVKIGNKYTLNQRICSLKSENNNNKFIYYIVNRNAYFLAFDSGVGQTNLKKNEVLSCPLKIPKSLKEQAKIANFLTSIDDKITAAETQLNATKQYKQDLLQ